MKIISFAGIGAGTHPLSAQPPPTSSQTRTDGRFVMRWTANVMLATARHAAVSIGRLAACQLLVYNLRNKPIARFRHMYDPKLFARLAGEQGFKRRRERTWTRETPDFVQLVNLQKSQWSGQFDYLNFALWPFSLGEPDSFSESRFPFRVRADAINAASEVEFFDIIKRFHTLDDLRSIWRMHPFNAFVHFKMKPLIEVAP